MRITSRLASVAAAVACAAVVFTGASSASADVAPPATTSPNLAFHVPAANDPAQTSVPVYGEIFDAYVTDNLNAFTIVLGCDGLAPVPVTISAPTVQMRNSKPVLHATILSSLPLDREGALCRIETTSPTVARELQFGDPSTKPGEMGSTARLYFSGEVLLKVTSRGGAY